jgi:hypothetical protein
MRSTARSYTPVTGLVETRAAALELAAAQASAQASAAALA